MSSSSNPSGGNGLAQIVDPLQEGIANYLPQLSQDFRAFIGSTALATLSCASFKNAPYTFTHQELGMGGPLQGLAARIRYLESALLSLVSTVHSLFFTLFYTSLVLATLGISSQINSSSRRHWQHVTYGLMSTGISLIGILTPYYAVILNLGFIGISLKNLKSSYDQDIYLFEKPLLRQVKNIVNTYISTVHEALRAKIDDTTYRIEHSLSLDYIEKTVNEAEKVEDLIRLASEIQRHWPKVGLNKG